MEVAHAKGLLDLLDHLKVRRHAGARVELEAYRLLEHFSSHLDNYYYLEP